MPLPPLQPALGFAFPAAGSVPSLEDANGGALDSPGGSLEAPAPVSTPLDGVVSSEVEPVGGELPAGEEDAGGGGALPDVGGGLAGNVGWLGAGVVIVDGAVVDGAVVDGAVVDGAVVDGAVVDGAVVDGAVVDGGSGCRSPQAAELRTKPNNGTKLFARVRGGRGYWHNS